MKCVSCEIDINPKWKHALDINVCPFCGKHIMEEHLKNLLATLHDTMDKLKSYQDQTDDWMLSNHNYIKTDSAELIDFVDKSLLFAHKKEAVTASPETESKKYTVTVPVGHGKTEEVQVEKIQDEETTNDFFKRAQVIKKNIDIEAGSFPNPIEKTEYLKKLRERIKKTGSLSINEEGDESIIDPETLNNADPEAIEEFNASMAGNEIRSSLPEINDGIPSIVLNMAKGNKSNDVNHKDLESLRKIQERINARESGDSFNSGSGSFSRGT